MNLIFAVMIALVLAVIMLSIGALFALFANMFSSFDKNNPKNRYLVNGKWLTRDQILDK